MVLFRFSLKHQLGLGSPWSLSQDRVDGMQGLQVFISVFCGAKHKSHFLATFIISGGCK